ncbi:hypothetical protein LSH36_302g02024 [Paralvinella palmiformis]|uniref:Uncharacterized protein n=1 Tax=Paralvinella palmiformis TaxID=53620 RepID=A0AAD9N1H3_9ANNE|nr:hypothetical protein LSH36_302g02024 [Paralvinella palmiformis]
MQQQVITTTTLRQPAVQIQESSESRIHHKYGSQTSLVLGALQVVIGLLCIFFNLAAILLGATHGRVCHGFWCGTIFIVGGIFGIKAAGAKTGCLITTFMVISIISTLLCVFLLSIAADGIERDKTEYCQWGFCISAYNSDDKQTREAQVAVNGLLVGLALAEIIFSIWSSVICCAAVCCGNATPRPGLVHLVSVPNQAQIAYVAPRTQTFIQPSVQTWIQPTMSTAQPQMIATAPSTNYAPPSYSSTNPGNGYVPPEAGMTYGMPAHTSFDIPQQAQAQHMPQKQPMV